VLRQNVAIAIGTDFDSFNRLSSIGGIAGEITLCEHWEDRAFNLIRCTGAAVSGSFLFVVGLANSVRDTFLQPMCTVLISCR
jgi:hypothetical protein